MSFTLLYHIQQYCLSYLHFLVIYFQAIGEEKKSTNLCGKNNMSGHAMQSIQEALTAVFATAIQTAYPDLPDAPSLINASGHPKFGDYQCNSAMTICQVS